MGAEQFKFSEEEMNEIMLKDIAEIKANTAKIPLLEQKLDDHLKQHETFRDKILYPILKTFLSMVIFGGLVVGIIFAIKK